MAPAPRWKPPGGGIRAPSRGITTAVRTKRDLETTKKKPARETASVDAPPLSSSDEEDELHQQVEDIEDISDSSSPDNDRSRGHIQPTVFKPSGPQRRSRLLVADDMRKSSVGSCDSGSESGQRGTKRPRPEDSPSKTNGDSAGSGNGNGSLFGHAWPVPKATYGGRQRLGSSTGRSTSYTSKTSRPVFKKYEDSASDISEPEEGPPKRKTPPRKTQPSAAPRARFIKPPEMSPEKPDTPKKPERREKPEPPKFKISKHALSDDDSYVGDLAKKKAEAKQKEKEKPPPAAVFKMPPTALQDLSSDEDAGRDKKREPSTFTSTKAKTKTRKTGSKDTSSPEDTDKHMTKKELMQSRQKWRKTLDGKKLAKTSSQIFGQLDVEGGGSSQDTRSTSPSSSAPQPPPPPPRAVFKMPQFNSDSFPVGGGGDGQDDSTIDLTELLGDDIDEDIDKDKADNDDNDVSVAASDKTMQYKGPAICPLCRESLDEAILRELLPNHYLLAGVSFARIARTRSVIPLNLLKFDEKMRFCQGHKQRTNRQAWAARGYPTIDWDALPARLVRYEKHIHGIIVGKTPSTFRTSWEAAKTTAAMAALITVPGYYGPRGMRVLSDSIVERHASTISKRIVEDALLASRGMYQFVETVLVPELAVQLIREDMLRGGAGTASEDEVRKVMVASAALGEELAEELQDVVEDEEDDEEDEDLDGDQEDDNAYDYMST
ncbi:hypothetical protein Sste5346_006285 [Sporothrix stenoceras]|uniref:Restriction of telomere capping protein 4 n=1 Tax=Sporothrix stenoceras TaxID=5173 RepID=A0ABR3Z0S0_9PEZI